jgi:F-type H+-transporting ATPase subunit gamma
MAQTRTLQRRIRSVKNAGQITKALEVVAASRMRRIQGLVAAAQTYGDLADSIMRRIAPSEEAKQHAFFKIGSLNAKLYIVFNSDRGQAGAFNANIFNTLGRTMKDNPTKQTDVLVFGRKGSHHFARMSNINMIGAYEDVPDIPAANYFAPVLETIQTAYTDGAYSSVEILYTHFRSSLSQTVERFQLLPISVPPAAAGADQTTKVFEFEPDIDAVLEEALRLYFEAKIMQARIEHAMRMVAMGNANRNASDLVESLTLEMNALRQATITQEIAEITGGAEAISA